MEDYYQILEIERDASAEQIKKSYKRLAKVFFPDFAHNDTQREYFNERMVKINAAYAVLRDPEKRQVYNQNLEENRTETQALEVSPSYLSFGKVEIGNSATNSFILHVAGDIDVSPRLELLFRPTGIFREGEISSVFPDKTFPLEVEVIVETKDLDPNSSYKGELVVRSGDVEAKVILLLQTLPASGFRFRSGETAHSLEDLIPLSDRYWDEAKKYLYEGHFKRWCEELRRNDVVAKIENVIREKNKDIGLEKFLHCINPSLGNPSITIEVKNFQLLDYNYSTSGAPKPTVVINNHGRGCCYGTIRETKGSLFDSKKVSFAIPPGETKEIALAFRREAFLWATEYFSEITIQTNSKNASSQTAEVVVTTSRDPFLVAIENLRDEGKWRLALERLEKSNMQDPNAQRLRASIEQSKSAIQLKLLIGTLFGYMIIGGVVGRFIFIDQNFLGLGAVLGAILGPVCALLYFNTQGGEKGKTTDYVISALVLAIILVTLGAIAGIVAAVIWLVVNILFPLLVFILIFIIVGGLASGGE